MPYITRKDNVLPSNSFTHLPHIHTCVHTTGIGISNTGILLKSLIFQVLQMSLEKKIKLKTWDKHLYQIDIKQSKIRHFYRLRRLLVGQNGEKNTKNIFMDQKWWKACSERSWHIFLSSNNSSDDSHPNMKQPII